jgi:ribose transport system permease protein
MAEGGTGSTLGADSAPALAEPDAGGAAQPPPGEPGRDGPGTAGGQRRAPSVLTNPVLVAVVERYGVLGVWVLMGVAFTIAAPGLFLTFGTFQAIFAGQEPLVFLAAALVCVLAVGEFDLSVAAILGLSATLVPVLVVKDHWSLPLAVIAAMIATTLAGLVNGVLIVRVRINPIVVTLGMATLLLGLELQQTELSTVTGLPNGFASFANAEFLGLPIAFYYGAVLMLAMAYVMIATRLGRHMIFVGANREVARLAGVRVNRIRLGAYVFSGFICGAGGVILVAGLGGFDPSTSSEYLLPAFAAAFLGSAMIIPGRFNSIGAFLAIYFLETGIIGLELLGYTGWISDVFFGAALIIAVAVSTVLRRSG